MGPLHWYAQPIVTGTPAPRTYQSIILIVTQDFTVDGFYLISNHRVVGCCEVIIGLYIDHVHHILTDAVSQRIVGSQQTGLIRYLLQILVQHLFAVHNRANLQQAELSRTVIVQVTGELYLHGAAHFISSTFLSHLQYLRQREYILLQDTAERDHFPASLVDTITDNLVVRVICRRSEERRVGK